MLTCAYVTHTHSCTRNTHARARTLSPLGSLAELLFCHRISTTVNFTCNSSSGAARRPSMLRHTRARTRVHTHTSRHLRALVGHQEMKGSFSLEGDERIEEGEERPAARFRCLRQGQCDLRQKKKNEQKNRLFFSSLFFFFF